MQNKQPDTQQPIHTLLAERWSPRAFDIDRPVEAEKLQALLEAARWAPSCFNDQPWRFIVCNRHTNEAAWETAVGVLADKNQLWARQAPLLILVCSD
ncbi:MAG: nitroreductase family protein, partial [Gammaproteobacteria bacterium]